MKRILLFGAGASVPYFRPSLTTNFLTKVVLNRRAWREIIQRYNNRIAANRLQLNETNILNMLLDICNINDNQNFEQIQILRSCCIENSKFCAQHRILFGEFCFVDIDYLLRIQAERRCNWQRVNAYAFNRKAGSRSLTLPSRGCPTARPLLPPPPPRLGPRHRIQHQIRSSEPATCHTPDCGRWVWRLRRRGKFGSRRPKRLICPRATC